jgi:acyl dehydratase
LIGKTLGRSPWLLIDQARIDAFADITEDPQFIHIDAARATAETPFGGTVAHGFLTLSMASRMVQDTIAPFEGQVMNLNAGFDRLRFLTPVRSGSRIRGVFELKDVKQTSVTQLRIVTTLTIEIESATKPALVADWVNVAVFPELE